MILKTCAGGVAGAAAALTLLGVLVVPAQAAPGATAPAGDVGRPATLKHLSALRSGATTSEHRFVVVTKRSAVTSVTSQLRALAADGELAVDEAPVGQTITVEAEPGSTALADARALAGVVDVVPEVTYSLFDTPDDPAVDDQSPSLNVLRLPAAWDITHGSSGVTIAVIDTGVAVNHPDLAGKVVSTHNAVDGSSSVTDTEGHGTFVASVAAAATDNDEGVAGAGWNSSVMAVKVARSDGQITNSALATGIDWAVAHGADVINMSLGSKVDDSLTRTAVANALAADVVVVAAAGNDGVSSRMYPAALPGVIAVGATSVGGGARASFSQYGSWVDVGAPGVSIIGANADYASDDDYLIGDGTSFASPLVAGIVGLLRDVRPDLDAAEVHAAIKSSTNGKDYGFYAGVVNASAALAYQFELAGPTVTTPASGATVSGDVDVHLTVPGGVDADEARVSVAGGPTVSGAVSGGAATLSLPTYGLAGAKTLHVVLCKATMCSPTGTDVAVDVDNDVPVITAPADNAHLDADYTVEGTSDAPKVRLLVDGAGTLATLAVSGGAFSDTMSISTLTPGAHTLSAVACNAAGTVCATSQPSAATHVFVDRLQPKITAVTPTRFSPNGDGVSDTVSVTYTLDVASDVVVRFQDDAGTDVRVRALPGQAAGTHTLTWTGVNDAAQKLADGSYTVFVDTTATVDATVLHGSDSKALVIDTKAPGLSSAVSTYPAVYPYNDDFRDSTALSVTSNEDTSGVTVTVYTSKGSKVWSSSKTSAPAGKVAFSFTGHSSSGAKLAAGSYSYQFRVRDKAGNLTVSGLHTIKVSWRKLVDKTFTKTFTPLASGNGSYYTAPGDACSSVTAYSDGSFRWQSCGGPVETIHHVTLPSATVYGAARVTAHGHGGSGAVAHFGYLADDGASIVGESSFSAANGTHSAVPVQVTSSLLYGNSLRFVVLLTDGDAYVIDSFSVVFHYSVLV